MSNDTLLFTLIACLLIITTAIMVLKPNLTIRIRIPHFSLTERLFSAKKLFRMKKETKFNGDYAYCVQRRVWIFFWRDCEIPKWRWDSLDDFEKARKDLLQHIKAQEAYRLNRRAKTEVIKVDV